MHVSACAWMYVMTISTQCPPPTHYPDTLNTQLAAMSPTAYTLDATHVRVCWHFTYDVPSGKQGPEGVYHPSGPRCIARRLFYSWIMIIALFMASKGTLAYVSIRQHTSALPLFKASKSRPESQIRVDNFSSLEVFWCITLVQFVAASIYWIR